MKRSLFLELVLVCFLPFLFIITSSAEPEKIKSGVYEYTILENGTAEICWYNGNASNLVVPTAIDGITVTSLGESSFASLWSNLITVTIPDSILHVGINPFAGCDKLSKIIVSQKHPTLAVVDGALYEKQSGTLICYPAGRTESKCVISKDIRHIGDYAFIMCNKLKSVSIPGTVTSIGRGAFMDSKSLYSITIGNGVTTIKDYAFCGCSTLGSISIPDSVVNIGINPFEDCENLYSVNVSPNNTKLAVIDGVLFEKASRTLIGYPAGKPENSYIVPDGIRNIAEDAFFGCENLAFVTIPNSVTSIGDCAFSYCKSLIAVNIPDGVSSISFGMFSNCINLTSVSIPDSVTTIYDEAFIECFDLESIAIPDSVTFIGPYVFEDCEDLTVTVGRDSYAKQYCETKGISYTYAENMGWLNN